MYILLSGNHYHSDYTLTYAILPYSPLARTFAGELPPSLSLTSV